MKNFDFHCHSAHSDGTLSPKELAYRAKANGVELWAMTDHDTLSGCEEAYEAASSFGLPFVTGVEISISYLDETVHMVGLGVDPKNAALLSGLQTVRSGRDIRAQAMADDLAKVGIPNAFEGALKYAGNPNLISRSHFARYMVEIGVCQNVSDVFRRYLAHGKPGFIPHQWASLEDAVAWVRDAGGVCVIAHPARYKFTANEERSLLASFQQLGGTALEVVTGNHSPSDVKKYADLAREFGFAASRGSDFHSPNESRLDLGCLPPLPESLTPVWELLEDKIH
jgi:hypothetical protein